VTVTSHKQQKEHKRTGRKSAGHKGVFMPTQPLVFNYVRHVAVVPLTPILYTRSYFRDQTLETHWLCVR